MNIFRFLKLVLLLVVITLINRTAKAETTSGINDPYGYYTVVDGLPYSVTIQGYGSDAVAEFATVGGGDNLSGAINIPSSITFQYIWVTYDEEGHEIEHTRILSCPVTQIGARAFERSNITSVTIPNSVTYIGKGAFSWCSGLAGSNLTIPNSVKIISEEAFWECGILNSLTIGNALDSVGRDVFFDTWAKELIYNAKHGPAGFGYGAERITIGNEVEILPGGFAQGALITAITIPSSVTTIGDYAFRSCDNLSSIIIPNSVTTIGKKAFSDCDNLSSIIISNSVTTIGDGAFSSCGMSYVSIGKSVDSIGIGAFGMPSSVYVIFWDAKHCEKIGKNSINGNSKRISFGDDVEFIPVLGHIYNNEITIPKSVTQIETSAFSSWELKTLYWNAKHCSTNWDYYTDYDETYLITPFIYCCTLSHIIIGNEVEEIGDYMFNLGDNYNNQIDTVTCYAITPPFITANCFSQKTYENALLEVPRESIEAYRIAEGWKEFYHIVAIEEDEVAGDLDGDGQVTISDVTALVDFILSDGVSSGDSTNADCDGDGKVTIVDLTALIDYLLSGSW